MRRRAECHAGLVWFEKSEKSERHKPAYTGLGVGRKVRFTLKRREELEDKVRKLNEIHKS